MRYIGVVWPLARSVADLETALRIIAGPDGNEAQAAPVPLGPTPAFKPKDLWLLTRWPAARTSAHRQALGEARLLGIAKALEQLLPPYPMPLDHKG